MKTLLALASACALLLTGCAAPAPQYSQAQLNAIETREVDASMNETFSAASNALFDAGYTIAMSDRQGGLITGSKAKDNSSARIFNRDIRDTQFVMSMQIRETAPNRSAVRVKTSVNGEPRVDKKAIDQIWSLMQRQVLMKEPLSEAAPPAEAPASPNKP